MRELGISDTLVRILGENSNNYDFVIYFYECCLHFQKSGKWCAVHVRVAWEIYHHQQKQQAEAQKNPADKMPDPLRPPSHMLPGGAVHRPTDLNNPLMPPGMWSHS